MIAGCPKCAARYRIDREKLVDGAVRLRCTKCEAVFRVRAPEEPSEPPRPAEPMAVPTEAAPPEAVAPAPVPQEPIQAEPTPQPVQLTAPPAAETPPVSNGPLILVAVPDADLAKRTGDALAAGGYRPIIVHDGAQAMLEIQRQVPSAVVLAADLPKMFGFQVCEVVKRNESLRHIHVVLAGAIHHPDRYRRPPEEIYGADSYLEAPDLPEGVFPILEGAGIYAGSAPTAAPAAPAPAAVPEDLPITPEPSLETEAPGPDPVLAPESQAAPPPVPAAVAPAPQVPVAPVAPVSQPAPRATVGAEPSLEEEAAKAERLARIIVSDIILYNEEKFTQSIAAGNVSETMGPDLAEGRGLFEERIDPRVRGDRDYLMDELLRVARLRGME